MSVQGRDGQGDWNIEWCKVLRCVKYIVVGVLCVQLYVQCKVVEPCEECKVVEPCEKCKVVEPCEWLNLVKF